MRSEERAFRATLIGLAAAIAAVAAHYAIDVLGDFMLAHDSYDDVAHGSRAVFVAAIAIVALAAVVRFIFDLIGRRTTSRTSLMLSVRTAAGSPVAFIARVVPATLLSIAGMEWFDCAAAHAQIDGIAALFGGSLVLGLSCTGCAAILAGLLLHYLVRLLCKFEPTLVALVVRLVRIDRTMQAPMPPIFLASAGETITCGLLLSRSGSKRGPPVPASA